MPYHNISNSREPNVGSLLFLQIKPLPYLIGRIKQINFHKNFGDNKKVPIFAPAKRV